MERCHLCPNVNDPIPSDGPDDCEIFFIGEAPGIQEQKEKRVFIGKTGQEVNSHYLPLAGLKREQVKFANAIKCLPTGHNGKLDSGRSKDVDILYACADCHLYPELQRLQPKLIVAMGAFACRAIDADIELDLQHGIPIETSFGTVFPMYHPAGGIHEPKKMLQIRTDWYRLGRYLKGKLNIAKDIYKNPEYVVFSRIDILSVLIHSTLNSCMACDTEITRFGEPYCLTFSVSAGRAYLIKADDLDSLNAFQALLDRWTGPILFHNWMFDKKVVEAMGLHFPEHLIVDTMTRAFHLGNLPQGLKPLAYRELGMRMDNFDDLVTPYSTPLCLDYLRKASLHEWPKQEESLVRDKDGAWKLYKPQSMGTKLKRFFTDLDRNPDKDIYGAWDNWEESHTMIEEVMGLWPGKDIRYAPFDKVLHYACRDADATLRLWHRQQQMTRQVRRTTQERWGE